MGGRKPNATVNTQLKDPLSFRIRLYPLCRSNISFNENTRLDSSIMLPKMSIGAFKSRPVLSVINLTGSMTIKKRRIKQKLEYSTRTIIATKNPISTVLRN